MPKECPNGKLANKQINKIDMKSRIINKLGEEREFDILEIELIADNTKEKAEIMAGVGEQLESYLSLNLQVAEIIQINPPFFVVKKVKTKLGFGGG